MIFLRLCGSPWDSRAVPALGALLRVTCTWLEEGDWPLTLTRRNVAEEYLPHDYLLSYVNETAASGFVHLLSVEDTPRALELVETWTAYVREVCRISTRLATSTNTATPRRLVVLPVGALVRFGEVARARRALDVIIKVIHASEDSVRAVQAVEPFQAVLLVNGIADSARGALASGDWQVSGRAADALQRLAVDTGSPGDLSQSVREAAIIGLELALTQFVGYGPAAAPDYAAISRFLHGHLLGAGMGELARLLVVGDTQDAAAKLFTKVGSLSARRESDLLILFARGLEDAAQYSVRSHHEDLGGAAAALHKLAIITAVLIAAGRYTHRDRESELLDAALFIALAAPAEGKADAPTRIVVALLAAAQIALRSPGQYRIQRAWMLLVRASVVVAVLELQRGEAAFEARAAVRTFVEGARDALRSARDRGELAHAVENEVEFALAGPPILSRWRRELSRFEYRALMERASELDAMIAELLVREEES